MSEKKQVSGYVNKDEKQSFKAHAESKDMSLSEWVAQACREKVEQEVLADDAQRYRVEERLLELVDDAAERAAEEIVEQVLTQLDEAAVADVESDGRDGARAESESDGEYSDWIT